MGKIIFEDLPSTNTPIDAETLNKLQDNIETAINGVILYDDVNGSNKSININESCVNFYYIDIEYRCNNYGYKTARLYNPNGKKVVLEYLAVASNMVVQNSSSIFLINETSISLQSSCMINSSTDNTILVEQNNNLIYITKVVGYKR